MWLQLHELGDAARGEETGQEHRRGLRISGRVVGADEGDVVAEAQVAEAVGPEALGIERAGQAQGAEAECVRDVHAGTRQAAGEEQPVELGVVRAHDAAVEERDELVGDVTHPGCSAQRPP
jgi:hypothetical protein